MTTATKEFFLNATFSHSLNSGEAFVIIEYESKLNAIALFHENIYVLLHETFGSILRGDPLRFFGRIIMAIEIGEADLSKLKIFSRSFGLRTHVSLARAVNASFKAINNNNFESTRNWKHRHGTLNILISHSNGDDVPVCC